MFKCWTCLGKIHESLLQSCLVVPVILNLIYFNFVFSTWLFFFFYIIAVFNAILWNLKVLIFLPMLNVQKSHIYLKISVCGKLLGIVTCKVILTGKDHRLESHLSPWYKGRDMASDLAMGDEILALSWSATTYIAVWFR